MNGSTSTVFDDDEEENLASAPSAASHAHLDVSAILSSPPPVCPTPTTYLLRSIKRDEAMQPARTRSKEGGSQPAREVNVDNKDTKKSDFKERVSLPSFHSLESGHMYFCFLGTSQYAILRAVPNRPSFRPSRPSKTMLPRRFRDAKVFRHLQLEDLEGAKKFSSAAIPTGRRLWVEIQ